MNEQVADSERMKNGEKKRKKNWREKMRETWKSCGHELITKLVRRRRKWAGHSPLAACTPANRKESRQVDGGEWLFRRGTWCPLCSLIYSTIHSALFTSHAHHGFFFKFHIKPACRNNSPRVRAGLSECNGVQPPLPFPQTCDQCSLRLSLNNAHTH